MDTQEAKQQEDLWIEPLDDRVLLEKVDESSVTLGGIFIPDTAKEPSQMAIIVACGTGRINVRDGSRVPMQVEVGDRVWVGKYAGVEIEFGGRKFNMVRESDCLGKVVNFGKNKDK